MLFLSIGDLECQPNKYPSIFKPPTDKETNWFYLKIKEKVVEEELVPVMVSPKASSSVTDSDPDMSSSYTAGRIGNRRRTTTFSTASASTPKRSKCGGSAVSVAAIPGWRLPDLGREWGKVMKLAQENKRKYDLMLRHDEILAEYAKQDIVKPFFDKLKKDLVANISLTPDELKIGHFCNEFVAHDQVAQLIPVFDDIFPNLIPAKRPLVIGLTVPMLVLVINKINMNEVKTLLGIKA